MAGVDRQEGGLIGNRASLSSPSASPTSFARAPSTKRLDGRHLRKPARSGVLPGNRLRPRTVRAQGAGRGCTGRGPANGIGAIRSPTTPVRRRRSTSVFAEALAAGATALKQPHDVFWGGYSGYFADPDGHLWEVAGTRSSRSTRRAISPCRTPTHERGSRLAPYGRFLPAGNDA